MYSSKAPAPLLYTRYSQKNLSKYLSSPTEKSTHTKEGGGTRVLVVQGFGTLDSCAMYYNLLLPFYLKNTHTDRKGMLCGKLLDRRRMDG
jgi:hypothetical protein